MTSREGVSTRIARESGSLRTATAIVLAIVTLIAVAAVLFVRLRHRPDVSSTSPADAPAPAVSRAPESTRPATASPPPPLGSEPTPKKPTEPALLPTPPRSGASTVSPSTPGTTRTGDAARAPIDLAPPTAPPTVPVPSAAPVDPGKIVEGIPSGAALPGAGAAVELRDLAPSSRVFDRESAALAQLLDRYEQAYDRLDANGAAAIWPSVDSRALARAFARLQQQDLDFGTCTFAVSENDAAARCAGVLRYARRIGDTSPKTEHHVWTIEFARVGEGWQIVRIRAQ